MNLIAVDVSSQNLSLYIRYRENKTFEFNRQIKFGASELVSFIDQSLKKISLSLDDVDAFVIGAGPGSFTGLRISFSVIKAFMIALGAPAITISSFYSCAYPFKDKAQKLAVISDARRGLIYLATFSSRQGRLIKDGRERLITFDEFLKIRRNYFFITYDSNLREQILSLDSGVKFHSGDIYPQAKYLMPLAEMHYNKGKFTPIEKLKPLYLHPKTCQIRKDKGRRIK